ncbi:MAG: transporter ATP-binding protein [Gemmatimonadetes bacterium]|nr:transporter ATP-binding protein [Gemmatimonadota bacterium]
MTPERRTVETARRHMADVYRAEPGLVVRSLALMLLAGLAEGVGVVMLVPLLRVAGIPVSGGAMGRVGEAVTDGFRAVGMRPSLPGVLLLYVAAISTQALFQRAQTLAAYQVEQRTVLRLRTRLYRSVAEARWLFLARQRASDFVHALTAEVDRLGSATSHLLNMLGQGAASAVYLLIALRISPAATATALGSGGLLLVALRGMRREAGRSGRDLSESTGDLFAAATEHVQAIKVVKSYGAEGRSVAAFAALGAERLRAFGRAASAYADARAAFTVGSVLLLAAATWLALGVLRLPVAVALLLVFVFSRLVPRLATLQQQWQMAAHELPAREAVLDLAERCEAERETLGEPGEPIAPRDAIRFHGVAFGYEGRDPVLRGVTLSVPARRTTALVGTSGAGKTTVADLLMGLATPSTGRITLDGAELTGQMLQRWRGGIGYVAQDTVLFHQSVRANLLWARPDAAEDEMRAALSAAAALEFVEALPAGLDTVIGDRGVRLSGGERQRLALARALLRRPALLILDEATSALDPENERRILDAIAGLHGRTTILLITHRLATVRDADVIHVLDGGRVVESGDWTSLTAGGGGRFREMWSAQETER